LPVLDTPYWTKSTFAAQPERLREKP